MMQDGYEAHIGSNLEPTQPQVEFNDDSYANLNTLLSDLSLLVNAIDNWESLLTEELDSLAVNLDQSDSRMVKAHRQEWPIELGEPSEQITYGYYRTLALSPSAAANYLREQYENAIREITGSPALDLLQILEITRNEAHLIQDFITRHVGGVVDSSEMRIVELLQDWTEAAIINVRKISRYAFSDERETGGISKQDLEGISRSEAKQGQAAFKIKMNTYNSQISSNLDFLRRTFVRGADTFYERFLGGALDTRLKAVRKNSSVPRPRSPIDDELKVSNELLNDDLRNAIADEVRRKDIYTETVGQLQIHVRERDKYRNLIKELSQKGKDIPNSGPGVVTKAVDTEQQKKFWQDAILSVNDGTALEPLGSLRGSHGTLQNLENRDDHPQYLLRSGGEVTGDIELKEDIRVGGIIPAKHRHTGNDGSSQIHASNIIGNTLRPDLIDLSQKPPTPIDLNIDEYDPDVIPPGIAKVDTNMSWEGFDQDTFEVQIVRVGKKAEQITQAQDGYLWIVAQDTLDSRYYIYQVDADTGTVVGFIPSPTGTPGGLDMFSHFGNQELWLADMGASIVYVINPSDGTIIDTIDTQVPDAQRGITIDGDTIWLMAEFNRYKIDRETHTIITQVAN